MKLKYSVEDQMAAVKELAMVDVTAMDVSGLAMLESVTAKKVGSITEYTIVIGEGMNSMLDGVMGLLGSESAGLDMRFGKMTATYTVDSMGNMKKIDMVFSASMKNRPFSLAKAKSSWVCTAEVVQGFSQMTCLPASKACFAKG